ncbi:hypothetical protein HY572_01765 [Candidatus Micrarchaeota archaeon]|nr:hypothetical protein [Candidatus Micrarchaeota archaeon]
MNAFIKTFGCTYNHADSDDPAAQQGILCRSNGYRPIILENAEIGRTHSVRIQQAGTAYLKAYNPEQSIVARF